MWMHKGSALSVGKAWPVIYVLLFGLFLISFNSFARTPARTAVEVVHIQGEAVLGKSTPLKTGVFLRAGSVIQTKANGRVLLRFLDGSTMLVQPNTQIKLREARKRRNGFSLLVDLISGQLDNFVTPNERKEVNYRVRTRSALAGVRGTVFRITTAEKGKKTTAEVLEGVVDFRRRWDGKTLELAAGEGSLISSQRKEGVKKTNLPQAPQLIDFPPVHFRSTVYINASPVKGALKYRIQISTSPTFESILHQAIVEEPSKSFSGLEDGKYYIRIRAIAGNGLEGPDTVASFLQDVRAEPPFLLFPKSNMDISTQNVSFEWTRGVDVSEYVVRILKDLTDKDVLLEKRTKENKIVISLAGGRYYWQVASVRDGLQGQFSEPSPLEVRTAIVSAVSVSKPQQGEFEVRWTGDNAQKFELQLSKDADFSGTIKTLTIEDAAAEIQLDEPGKYFLRVRALDKNGEWGDFSEVQQLEYWRPFPWWMLAFLVLGL